MKLCKSYQHFLGNIFLPPSLKYEVSEYALNTISQHHSKSKDYILHGENQFLDRTFRITNDKNA